MRIAICTLLLLLSSCLSAQGLYFVQLTDKFNSGQVGDDYFSEKCLLRKLKMDLPASDNFDIPINEDYHSQVAILVNEVRYQLRWLNMLTVDADERQIEKLRQLPFVQYVEEFELKKATILSEWTEESNFKDSLKINRLLRLQNQQMKLGQFKEAGLTGENILIAVFDAGFKGADTHAAFSHLRKANRIKACKDFYGIRKHGYYHSGHGTAVLSCIAGKFGEEEIGAATNADFLLARTESKAHEKYVEEDHWLAAMEWADQHGADIISSSLGYGSKRYKYADMDGNTTRVTKAAKIAARKGILVINSAGNEGNARFHYINAPADADSVLAVGASFPMFPMHMRFSSYGPNSLGVLKPNVSAPGAVTAAHWKGGYDIFAGTSFSCPLVAGFAACLMQKFPDENNMDIFRRIEKSGHFYPYYDYGLGFGVPDANHALAPNDSLRITLHLREERDTLFFDLSDVWAGVDSSDRRPKIIYYHLRKKDGSLKGYNSSVLEPGAKVFFLPSKIRNSARLYVWFDGYLFKDTVSPIYD